MLVKITTTIGDAEVSSIHETQGLTDWHVVLPRCVVGGDIGAILSSGFTNRLTAEGHRPYGPDALRYRVVMARFGDKDPNDLTLDGYPKARPLLNVAIQVDPLPNGAEGETAYDLQLRELLATGDCKPGVADWIRGYLAGQR